MSEGLNRVLLLGGLTADPEIRYGQNGSAVLKIRLAITENYLDKDKVRRERTEYQNVVVFGRRGEALGKILSKGSQVFVEGSLRTSSYEKDGAKVYRTEVVATNVILAGGKRGQSNAEEPAERGQSSDGGYGGGAASAPPVDDPGFGNDDEIPFAYIGADPKDDRQLPRKWL